MTRTRILLLAICLSLSAIGGTAQAGSPKGKGGGGPSAERAAAEQAQARYGGRVLDISPAQGNGGPPSYRVKLLNQGEVRTVTVPAPTEEKGPRARPDR